MNVAQARINDFHKASHKASPVLEAVKAGLMRRSRTLPPWLFYDDRGSELFEDITRLPEYYLTRAEHEILQHNADEIVSMACEGTNLQINVVELGAGSATKTQLLLDAVVRKQGKCLFLPIDVSSAALEGAVLRLRRESPGVTVRPFAGTYLAALPAIRQMEQRQLVMFVGSSIGNYSDTEAENLLSAVALELQPGACLLLGTDRAKDVPTLLRAYDDAAGVTAAFNLNLLVRLNRELGCNFDLSAWRHEARWNEGASRVEMHLVSMCTQKVLIPEVGSVPFASQESIHTESSVKYTRPHVDRLLAVSGFERTRTFTDSEQRFDLHLARRSSKPRAETGRRAT